MMTRGVFTFSITVSVQKSLGQGAIAAAQAAGFERLTGSSRSRGSSFFSVQEKRIDRTPIYNISLTGTVEQHRDFMLRLGRVYYGGTTDEPSPTEASSSTATPRFPGWVVALIVVIVIGFLMMMGMAWQQAANRY
jgi:hypothetical protein